MGRPARRRALSVGEYLVEIRTSAWPDARLDVAGDTYTAATTLHRTAQALGLDVAVGILTGLGDDPCSEQIRRVVSAAGLDDRSILVPGSRPTLRVARGGDDGEPRFTYWRGDCATTLFRTSRWIDDLSGDLVHFSGRCLGAMTRHSTDAFLHQLVDLSSHGTRVTFDTTMRLDGDPEPTPAKRGRRGRSSDRAHRRRTYSAAAALLDDAAGCSDVVFVATGDEEKARGWTDPWAIADHYRSLGPAEVVVRIEGGGVIVAEGDRRHRLAAQPDPGSRPTPSPRTRETATFVGAYLAARLADEEPPEAARIAATAASSPGQRSLPRTSLRADGPAGTALRSTEGARRVLLDDQTESTRGDPPGAVQSNTSLPSGTPHLEHGPGAAQ